MFSDGAPLKFLPERTLPDGIRGVTTTYNRRGKNVQIVVGYETEVPDGYQKGYVFGLCLKGHGHCACRRAGFIEYISFHSLHMGDWPFIDMPKYAYELGHLLGEDWEISYMAPGLIKWNGPGLRLLDPREVAIDVPSFIFLLPLTRPTPTTSLSRSKANVGRGGGRRRTSAHCPPRPPIPIKRYGRLRNSLPVPRAGSAHTFAMEQYAPPNRQVFRGPIPPFFPKGTFSYRGYF